MSLAVRLSREAEDDLVALSRADRNLYQRILRKIESLADNSMAGKPLVGNHKGEFSLRVGEYRIIYEIHAARTTVFILTAKHRRHVY